jgi:plasmid stability protein
MSERSPLSAALVQLFVFNDVASDDDDGEHASLLFRLTPLQLEQAQWAIENLILKERGIKKAAQRLHMIGVREHGEKFDADARHALTAAVKSDAGPDVTAAAKGLFERMTAEEKLRFYPPKYWG